MVKVLFLAGAMCLAATIVFAAGQVEVQTVPEGADIFVDFVTGVQVYKYYPEWYTDLTTPLYIGRSPVVSKPLGEGLFVIQAVLEGYERKTRRVELPEQGIVRVELRLKHMKSD